MRKLMDRLAELTRRKSFRFGLVGILALVVTLVAAQPVFAQTNQSLGPLDQIMSWLAAIGLALAEVIGKLVIAVLDITIPVMQYQGFTTSPVVVAGWAIVRDVVNMFFVVVLIVIAMGTIFGHSRFQWKQQVPKLMIFALVINFSKTLCGLMIDFAQVVMITFANALKDIAGGNFIQLLGLGDIFSLSEKAGTIAGAASGTGPGASAFDWFAASMAAVLMMVWVLAVVIMLLFVLVYRVVMLWILIVLAPLAWFMGGQSVFKSDAYGEWWKNFICYTAIGPVITFFLWLTLAVAGSGFIAANDPGLSAVAPAGDLNSNAADFVTKIFEWQRLTSFVVGMAMLMVGFDAASKICHGVKGPGFQAMLSAGKGVPGKIGGYVGGNIRKYGGKGLAAGYAGGKGLAAGGATAAGLALAGQGINLRGEAQAQAKRDLAKKTGMPDFVSKRLLKSADVQQKDVSTKLKTAAEEEYKDMSGDSKLEMLARYAKNGMPIDPNGKKAALGLFAEAMKDPKMREKLEARGVLGDLYREHGDDLKKKVRNTPEAASIDEFEAGRPDITGNLNGINTMDDVNKLDPAALARLRNNPDFRKRLAGIKTDTKKKYAAGSRLPNGTVATVETEWALSASEYFDEGYGGVKKQKAWQNGMTGVYEGMGNVTLAQVPAEEIARNASEELLNRRPDAAGALLATRDPSARTKIHANPKLYQNAAGKQLGFTFSPAGAVTGVRDSRVMNAAVKSNPSVLANIPTRDIESNYTLARNVAASLNDSVLGDIAKQYQKASADERASMDASVVENAFQAMEYERDEANTRGDTAAATKMDGMIENFHKRLVKIDGTKADIDTKLNAQITSTNAALAAEAAKPRPDPAVVSRLTEDVRRLGNRVTRHAALP